MRKHRVLSLMLDGKEHIKDVYFVNPMGVI
jgi:hypothetical protein